MKPGINVLRQRSPGRLVRPAAPTQHGGFDVRCALVDLGAVMHRAASPVVSRLQHLANTNPKARRVLARLSGPMRDGPRPIATGPAKGLLIDVAGSRPSYALGTAEPEVVQFLEQHVRKGDLVFDLGANVGYFTLIAAVLTGSAGKVVAYEPVPKNVRALRHNVALNKLANVEVVEAAVSGKDGAQEIGVATSDQQATLVGQRDAGTLLVQTVSLDSEASRVGRPSVIKCDIEGAEYEAFAESASALREHPAILVEVHRMKDGDEDRFEAIMRSHGFETEWIGRAEGAWTSHLIAVRDQ